MTAIVRALIEWARTVLDETPEQYVARKYPHLTPPPPWNDGTDL